MNVKINGETREIGHATIGRLVAALVDKPNGLIVELNGIIVKRDHWEDQSINDGDAIELIRFVGGG